ncbi:hypothetical protein JCM19236_6360 [Vibrio sp. JCM 19236]|nr:hypothetical protein JCM19236_6360 [Vibrio sp. JCM 19236]
MITIRKANAYKGFDFDCTMDSSIALFKETSSWEASQLRKELSAQSLCLM